MTKVGIVGSKFSEQEIYDLADELGTPFFLIDEEVLRKKVSEVEQAFTDFKGALKVAYSVKANFNPSVIRTFIDEGVMFDLTATNELHFLLKCGGSPESVIYTSITETLSEYETVLELGVKRIVVASSNGLSNLIEASAKTGADVRVMIRVNPEVSVHAELRGSLRHGKFGLQFYGPGQDNAFAVLRKILATPFLRFEGFHFHLGSQIEDPLCYAEAVEKLESFVLDTRKRLGRYTIGTLDIGGGLPVSYGKTVRSPKDVAGKIVGELNSFIESVGNGLTLIVESGRFLSAESTVLVARIVNVKRFGENKYVYLDAGYHTLLDSALLKHEYPVEVVPGGKQASEKTVLVGRLCDPLDVFPTSVRSKLGDAEVGKLVVFGEVGAYSLVLNTPFHSQPRPSIIMRNAKGNFVVVRKAQTVDELFMDEGGNCLS